MTKRAYRRVGRGQSSTRGKTSGRGGKGQTARAGNKRRPELRDMIKKLPKRRGYGKNRARTVNAARVNAFPVSLETLEIAFPSGGAVNPKVLAEMNIIPSSAKKAVAVKILGTGTLTKKLTVTDCTASAGAKAAIEKAGGSISFSVKTIKAEKPAKTEKIAKPKKAK